MGIFNCCEILIMIEMDKKYIFNNDKIRIIDGVIYNPDDYNEEDNEVKYK